jgi:hypothetical protein
MIGGIYNTSRCKLTALLVCFLLLTVCHLGSREAAYQRDEVDGPLSGKYNHDDMPAKTEEKTCPPGELD